MHLMHSYPSLHSNRLTCCSYSIGIQDGEKEGKREYVQECVPTSTESSESCKELLFNPNVFTEFKLAGSQEVSFKINVFLT